MAVYFINPIFPGTWRSEHWSTGGREEKEAIYGIKAGQLVYVCVCGGGGSEINVFIWKKENVLVFANCQTYLLNGFMTECVYIFKGYHQSYVFFLFCFFAAINMHASI